MKQLRARLAGSGLARNSLWALGGTGVRLAVQAAYFILVARSLGARGYGAFVGVVALVAIVSPFASLGSGNLLIKYVSRSPQQFERHWGRAVAMTGISGALLLIATLAVSRFVLPSSIDIRLVAAIGIADLIGTRLLEVASQAYQAFERLSRTMLVLVTWSMVKLAAVVLLYLSPVEPSPLNWGLFYMVSTLAAAVFAVSMVSVELGKPRFVPRMLGQDLTEGFYFSVSLAAQSIYNDIDKTMLARLSTLTATGIYGAAYRLVHVAFVPVRSVLFATYPRFFRHGAGGVCETRRFMLRIVPLACLYAGAAAVALAFCAPVVHLILGPGYAEVGRALRWLALLPLLKSLHYFPADALTGAGHQGARTAAQVMVAAWNLALCFVLIPAFGWVGAAWASLASDGALVGALWLLVWWYGRIAMAQDIAAPPASAVAP